MRVLRVGLNEPNDVHYRTKTHGDCNCPHGACLLGSQTDRIRFTKLRCALMGSFTCILGRHGLPWCVNLDARARACRQQAGFPGTRNAKTISITRTGAESTVRDERCGASFGTDSTWYGMIHHNNGLPTVETEHGQKCQRTKRRRSVLS